MEEISLHGNVFGSYSKQDSDLRLDCGVGILKQNQEV